MCESRRLKPHGAFPPRSEDTGIPIYGTLLEQQFEPVSWQIKAIALSVACLILAWQASAHIFGWIWEELAKPTLDRTVTKAKARAIAEFYSLLDSIVTLAIGL